MPNFVAEFTGRSLLAFCCCTLVASLPVQTALAQDNDAAEKEKGDSPDDVKPPPAEKPFEMGTAKDAAEYEVMQKRAIQQINLNGGFLTPKILQDYKKYEKEYRTVIRQGLDKRNPEDQMALNSGLNYRSVVLSDPDVQNDPVLFQGYMKNLERDVGGAAPQAMIPNASARSQLRQMVCGIVYKHLEQQITKGNFKARSAALEQLLNLEVVPGRNRQRIEMYNDTPRLLVQVMTNPNQPDAVKLRAANVMKKYLQKADAIPQVEMAFAEAIASELKRQWLAVPYLNSLVNAMEWVKAPRKVDGDRSPVVFCSMVELIQNKQVDIYIRCRAARTLGRCGFDRNIDFEPLAWGTADLTKETALEYSQSKNPKDPKWVRCGWFLYTAFHHETGKETDGPSPFMPKGFLNRAPQSQTGRKAYETSVPVLAHLMDGGNPKQIGRLTNPLIKWLNASKPANMKCDPLCPAIGGPPAADPN